jgi:hypothetical protein
LSANFTAKDCKDSVIVTGADGVFVPVVTETQKKKRRESEKQKRCLEKRKSTRKPGAAKRGAQGGYKEAKIVSFYSQDKQHQHVAATFGNSKQLGRLMRREACKVGISDARFSYSVADGAGWIEKQYRCQLPMLDANVLDWYHFKEHVVEASHKVYGEQTIEAKKWQKKMLDAAWEQGSLVMLHKLGAYERRHRGENRQVFMTLRKYVEKRITMTDYPAFREQGYDCGSGPTESQCGTLTARVKGAGMRWDTDNAAAMLALAALGNSNLWNTYWSFQRAG